jgi:cobalt-zinc-cadmium efflux system membrane fusion protein
MLRYLGWIVVLLVVTGVGTLTAENRVASSVIKRAWNSVRSGATSAAGPSAATTTRPIPPPGRPWDGRISLDDRQEAAMGLQAVKVEPQSAPLVIELQGTTAYDPDSLVKVRPRFDSLVSKVHATLGQTVRKGAPVIDLYSAQLAEAKSAYEEKFAQWDHDRRQLERHRELVEQKVIANKQYLDTVNDEQKSHLEYKLARDKLLVYGLDDNDIKRISREDGSQKARMTIRAPSDGVLIERDAVPGNLYDVTSTLMVIAPLDHLWVWGNVYENDIDKVRVGQILEVQFPYLDEKIRGKVEYISNRVDPGTHAIRIRASIPNPEGRLKSDMLVRTMLEIPPEPGWIAVPRVAMVTADGDTYLFIRKEGLVHTYERRSVQIVQEKADRVVVRGGLGPGEMVVTNASLLLSQLYEDLAIANGGLPHS